MFAAISITISACGVFGAMSGAASTYTNAMWPVYSTLSFGVLAVLTSLVGMVAYLSA